MRIRIGKELLDHRLVIGVVRDYSIREIGHGGEPGAFIPSEPVCGIRSCSFVAPRRNRFPLRS